MMESNDELSQLVGRRVADRRAWLTFTLDDLAERSGVSRAMISRIERGEVQASAVVLDRLCGGLGITLSALFARSDEQSPLARRGDQPIWRDPASGYVRRDVSPKLQGLPFSIVEVEFPAGSDVAMEPSAHRTISQMVWLLDGEIEITVSGQTHQLKPGDCLYMRPDDGIRFRNLTGRPARYAVILNSESRS
jgi:transcriptional regulator with XRE-family HTH domain